MNFVSTVRYHSGCRILTVENSLVSVVDVNALALLFCQYGRHSWSSRSDLDAKTNNIAFFSLLPTTMVIKSQIHRFFSSSLAKISSKALDPVVNTIRLQRRQWQKEKFETKNII